MGRTMPSVSGRIEERMARWAGFARHLRPDEREAFESLARAVRDMRGAIDAADEPDLAVAMLLAMAVRMEAGHERARSQEREGQERLP